MGFILSNPPKSSFYTVSLLSKSYPMQPHLIPLLWISLIILYVPSCIILDAYLKIAFLRWSHPLLPKLVVMVFESWYSFLFVLYSPMTPDTYSTQEILHDRVSCFLDMWSEVAHHIEEWKGNLDIFLEEIDCQTSMGNIQWALQNRKYGWESRKEITKAGMGTEVVWLEILHEWERECVISKMTMSLLQVKLRYCNRNSAGRNTITIII